MKHRVSHWMAFVLVILTVGTLEAFGQAVPLFRFDPAEQTVSATMLEGTECYDPSVVQWGDRLWIAWLEFVPGQGDRLWVGQRKNDGWAEKQCLVESPARLARPTLTVDALDRLCLTYEAAESEGSNWDVFLRCRSTDASFGQLQRVSQAPGNDINHRVSADLEDGLWLAWQSDRDGQFDIAVQHVGNNADNQAEVEYLGDSPNGDWYPDIATGPDGFVCIAWDVYDGESFNVVARRRVNAQWQPRQIIAGTKAFEGRVRVACKDSPHAWILWEEGSENWGKPYRSRPGPWNNMTDTYGPLHRFRRLHIARLDAEGAVCPLAEPLPMPSWDAARRRENRLDDVEQMGAFYERGQIVFDDRDRLWAVYRHFYRPQLGTKIPNKSHIERGSRLFARCLEGERWSELVDFDIHQRDGLQRLSVTPHEGGLALAWTTGRTDRRKDPHPRGIALALLETPEGIASKPQWASRQSTTDIPDTQPPASPKPIELGGQTYHLVFGDLHRHTDLSLCFPFFDGSLEDAYRYAIDVSRLDFLGITDHTRDISHGNALSLLWWRSTKEVTRHRLSGTFFPYFTFERSHGATDHNVISLRDDRIRNFPPPLPKYWKELGRDTFTIPHAPINARACWGFPQDDALRPLVEIYQGCRDYDSQKPANVGLLKGHRLGFIASSDHLSTGASFACVWTPEVGHEPIFRSMQSRRTYGATDKIRLVFRCGEHWMGERITTGPIPEFQIEIDGTAPLATIDMYRDGTAVSKIEPDVNTSSIRTTYRPKEPLTGKHFFYFHLMQTDGNQAWSSPLWVEVEDK